jgi:hypothetical protein
MCLAMMKFLMVVCGLASHSGSSSVGESTESPIGQRDSMPFKGSRIIPEQSKQIKMGRDEFKSSRHT